jgi:glycerophosphoryl diester phosphodiesterase
VELDAQLTSDGRVALCHDRTLARYGHGDRVVEEMAWSELAALDMGAWFSPHLYGGERMITLVQLFEQFGPQLFYHVELKGRALELPAAVHALITEYDLHERCIITSFSYDSLVAMREIDNEIRLGWLVREFDGDVLAQARALHLYQLCPFAGTITPESADMARAVAPEVRAWGLLGETAPGQAAEVQTLIHRVLRAGCDGMTINWPDWVSHA